MGLRLLILTLSLASPNLLAQTLPCLWNFAAMTNGDTPDLDLITSTYGQLVERLGGSRIGLETLYPMVLSGDPFTVPETEGAHLHTLQKNLKGFRSMLEAKGWNVPEIRFRLINGLKVHLKEQAQGEAQRTENLKKTATDFELKLPSVAKHAISPDGEWILSLAVDQRGAPHLPTTLHLTHVPSRTTWAVPSPLRDCFDATFSADGKSVIFADQKFTLKSVPFSKGALQWSAAKTVGVPKGKAVHNTAIKYLVRGPGPDLYLGSPAETNHAPFQYFTGLRGLFLFDAAKGTRTPVKVKEYIKSSPDPESIVHTYGTVPGTNLIYLNMFGASTRTPLHFVTVDAGGKLTAAAPPIYWTGTSPQPAPDEPIFRPDGKRVAAIHKMANTIMAAGLGSAANEPRQIFPTDATAPLLGVKSIAWHPTSGDLYVMVRNGDLTYRVDVIDGTNGNPKASWKAPEMDGTMDLSVSPDGNSVLLRASRDPRTILMNPVSRSNEP